MGLFIGASILTILELFDYLYEVRHPGASANVMSF